MRTRFVYRLWLITLFLLLMPVTLLGQGFSGAVVTAPSLIFVSGQQMQLAAESRDGQGNPRNNDQFIFRSSNANIVSVDGSGIATAKSPGIAGISAVVQGTNFTTSTVQLQVIPLRIDISAASPTVQVGDSLQFSATAVDINEMPIPGVAFRWQVTGANGFNTRAAAINSSGLMVTSGIGLMTIHAQIVYSGQSAAEIPIFEGLAQIEVRVRKEYRLTRMLANTPLERSFTLRPDFNSEPGVNDSGQIAFTANLDGIGSALMFYDKGNLLLATSAGIPGPLGGFLWNFEGPPAINNRGEVLVRVNTSNGSGLMRASPYSGFTYFMENGTAEGFNRMNSFRVGRYSYNDQGDMLLLANFQLIGETVFHTGLFLFNDQSFRYIWANTDALPSFPASYQFDNSFFGVDKNGVVYFRVTGGGNTAIFRFDGSSTPVKIAGTGTSAGGVQFQNVWNLALSPNGSVAFNTTATNGQPGIARARDGANLEYLPQRALGQILSVNDNGDALYVGWPGANPWGVHAWPAGAASATQYLRFSYNSDFPLDGGENPFWARTGKITNNGEVYVSLDTYENHLVVARLDGKPRTLWKAGTALNLRASLNFQGLVPGANSGSPHTFGGDSNASILEIGAAAGFSSSEIASGFRTLWAPGDRPVRGINGTNFTHASKSPIGDLYLTFGDGIIRMTNGRTETVLRFPTEDYTTNVFDKTTLRGPAGWYDGNNALSVNSSGSFVFNARTDRENRLELYDRGAMTPIMIQAGASQTVSPTGGKFSGVFGASMRQNAIVIDERGRVLVHAQVTGGPAGVFLYDNGQWKAAALFTRTIIDGATVTNCRTIRVAGEKFYALLDMSNGTSMIAQYDGQVWTPLVRRFDVMPDGTGLNGFFNTFAVNRRGEIAYAVNANGEKIVFRSSDGVNHLVYSEMTPTDDGDRLPNQTFEFDIRDDGLVYFAGFDSTDRNTIYKAERIQ